MLTARKISKNSERKPTKEKILHQVDLSVEQGEFLGIMGPSGSGKTTLLQVLSGIARASEGIVEINGKALHQLKGNRLFEFRRKQLGFVFQNYHLLGDLTVQENIMLPFALTRKRNSYLPFAEKLGEELGILEIFNKYPSEISGGEQQRTAIARAFITQPRILFADEPTGALDSKATAIVMDKLADFNKNYGQSILMVTHDEVTASYCSRVLFLKDGRIYTELYRGDQSQQAFYRNIMETQAIVGGF